MGNKSHEIDLNLYVAEFWSTMVPAVCSSMYRLIVPDELQSSKDYQIK